MANENGFTKVLQNSVEDGVLDNRTDLEKRRDELKKSIEELESNVIKDPRTLEKLKKELEAVEKQIKQEDMNKAVETGEVVGKGAAEKDVDEQTKQEELNEAGENAKNNVSQEEATVSKEKEEELRQVYHDAMIALHEKRMQTISKQIENELLVSSNEDYELELKLESELYEARDAYLALGKEDPYREKRTELIKQEKNAREPIELELRNRAKRFREIEEEIKKIDKREQEINEQLLSKDINETQIAALNKELGELGVKRKELELELADIKDKLDQAIDTRRERLVQRAGLEKKHVETLTYEDKKNYDYQKAKVDTMNQNFDEATKQHYDNIKRRIEEREQKIKDINKELKEVPDTDFERRLVLLNELDKETSMLEADREAKSDLDRGIIPEADEMQKQAKDKAENEKYRQEEFDKATDDARIAVEEQKEQIGEAVVENPEVANEQEKDRDSTLIAATVAVAYDSPEPGKDNILEDAGQYAVTKCVIDGLEDKVRNPNIPEDAKAMVAHDEQLKEADNELDKVQENIENKTQR